LTWVEKVVRLLFGRFEGMKNYGPVHRVLLGYQVMIESKMGKAVVAHSAGIKKAAAEAAAFFGSDYIGFKSPSRHISV
jgi:hypothetical protein